MAIGYACMLIGDDECKISSCVLKGLAQEKIMVVSARNLAALERIIDYNIKNKIKLFRISSDIIPFASHPVNKLEWTEIFKVEFERIGEKIKNSNMRVSMHPGQYTVLNSPDEEIVKRAVDDLIYHCRFLDSLNLDRTHKIVLHVGGVYNNKEESIRRFIYNYNALPDNIKKRLIIENDDRSYNVEDVLEISKIINIPVVFDNLHHITNPPKYSIDSLAENLSADEKTLSTKTNNELTLTHENKESENNEFDEVKYIIDKKADTETLFLDNLKLIEKETIIWINKCGSTWSSQDGNQKIHYSQSKSQSEIRSHSSTINLEQFINFYNLLENHDIDIMLEVKDKNLSAIKCIYATTKSIKKSKLEEEWARYKYFVLSKSVNEYKAVSTLFNCNNKNLESTLFDNNDTKSIDTMIYSKNNNLIKSINEKVNMNSMIIKFYEIIEKAIEMPEDKGANINAAQHIWGYVNDKCSHKDKNTFIRLQNSYLLNGGSITSIKNFLYKKAKEQSVDYLIKSLYFFI